VKFNNKKIQEFPLEKRKRKISPIICQKNSEISPGKKPLVPSSPPQNILRGPPYVVYGMYQISGMYCTGALIPGFRGIFMVQKDKTFRRHKKHTWVEVFNKNLWQSERQFPDKGRSQWITSELNY
jgi:hypothetical protein